MLAIRCARLEVLRGPDQGKSIQLGERTTAVIGLDPDVDLPLTDDSISRRHAELRASPAGYVLRDLGSTNGIRIGALVVREAVLGPKATFSLGETDFQFTLLSDEVQHALSSSDRFGSVLGAAPVMREMFAILEGAAKSDATLLLEGESGTGKEAITESVHRASSRANGPFVVVDGSAIAPELIESELFGHEKGAFTGALNARDGAFVEAHGGTLFLDEVGELSASMQPKFLRALEQRKIKRVGGSTYQPVDVRVIAATHRDLQGAVKKGTFRQDLYYRLAVIKVQVPPLRHHLEDVPLLARQFVRQLQPKANPDELLTAGTLAAFSAYAWPGNVRELRNATERLMALGNLPSHLTSSGQSGAAVPGAYHQTRRAALDRFEMEYCEKLLSSCDGVVARAAERAGISRQMFHRLLQKHGLVGREP
jgi:DNA-binding NtrC family response regulator